ncbi:MAG: 30S ribosome-binding factor RbfA [Eubacteriaceae bacterium]|jgi:ribosome-binding factor A|nr:30S ribosome-binding factor RbfA [Eubacteriaceae bacterium]
MASYRIERINEQIQRELSLIIQSKMKDNRLKKEGLSVTKVKTTPDLKMATVYISQIGTKEEGSQAVEILEKAKGFLRSALGKVLTYHSVPALSFVLDDSVEYSLHIEKILDDLKKEKLKKDEESDSQ